MNEDANGKAKVCVCLSALYNQSIEWQWDSKVCWPRTQCTQLGLKPRSWLDLEFSVLIIMLLQLSDTEQ